MKSPKELFVRPESESGEPEEFDLVILDGGTRSSIAAGTFARNKKRAAITDEANSRGPGSQRALRR